MGRILASAVVIWLVVVLPCSGGAIRLSHNEGDSRAVSAWLDRHIAALSETYKHFHSNPELSLQEVKTAALIAEELVRLTAHLAEWRRLMGEGGSVGRTLDFLIQEMNREANTIASKADDLELSRAAIATKSLLEKLREQVQNLE